MKKKSLEGEISYKEEPKSTIEKEQPDQKIDLFGGPHKKKKRNKWKEEFAEELEKMKKEDKK